MTKENTISSMGRQNKSRATVIWCVTLVVLGLSSLSVSPVAADLTETCTNSQGSSTEWTPIAEAGSASNVYHVVIMQEVLGGELRIVWANQHPQTYISTSITIDYWTTPHDSGRITGFWNQIPATFSCGSGPYNLGSSPTQTSDATIKLAFSGLTEAKQQGEGETLTTSVWTEETDEWGVKAGVTELSAEYKKSFTYGESTSTSWEATSSVTWTSVDAYAITTCQIHGAGASWSDCEGVVPGNDGWQFY